MPASEPIRTVQLPREVAEKVVRFTMEEQEANIGGLVRLICDLCDQLRSANAMVDSQRVGFCADVEDLKRKLRCTELDLGAAQEQYKELARLALPGLKLMLLAFDLIGPEGTSADGYTLRESTADMIAELEAEGY